MKYDKQHIFESPKTIRCVHGRTVGGACTERMPALGPRPTPERSPCAQPFSAKECSAIPAATVFALWTHVGVPLRRWACWSARAFERRFARDAAGCDATELGDDGSVTASENGAQSA